MGKTVERKNMWKTLIFLMLCMCFMFNVKLDVKALGSSGTCGNGCSWSFSAGSGTLSITGNTSQATYPSIDTTFQGNTEIKKVTIDRVYTINANAFKGCTNLTQVTINSNINIGNSAFENCTNLSGFTFNKVLTIGESSFRNCGKITSANLSQSGTIGSYAFYGCRQLWDVEFGTNITSIGNYAFQNSDVDAIDIPGSITTLNVSNVFDSDLYVIEFGAINGSNIIVPSTVTQVTLPYGATGYTTTATQTWYRCDSGSFGSSGSTIYQITGDKKLVIKGVSDIRADAFKNKTSFTSVEINYGIDSIKSNAFKGCTKLAGTLTIPGSVTTIGDSAFDGCNGLTGTLTIPSTTTSIGDDAFYDCYGFDKLNLNSGMSMTIGKRTFSWCDFEGELEIPSRVTSLGYGVFNNCDKLTSVTFKNDSITLLDGNSIFSGCNHLTTVHLPNNLTKINDGLFENTPLLETINIPTSVTYIGKDAFNISGIGDDTLDFSTLTKLKTIGDNAFTSTKFNRVTLPSGVTSIGTEVFKQANLVTLTVPAGTVSSGLNTNAFANAFTSFRDYTSNNGSINNGTLSGWTTGKEIKVRLDIAAFTLTLGTSTYTYNGQAKTPTVTVGTSLTKDTDYKVSYSNNVNAGTSATVTVTGINDYAGTLTKTFTINKADISPSVTMSNWTYGNTASSPSISGNSGSGTVTYTYSGSYTTITYDNGYQYASHSISNQATKPSNAGSYTVTATVAATTNYNGGSCSTAFTINKANINPSVTISNWTYGGTANTPSVSGNTDNGHIDYTYKGTVNGGTTNGYNSSTKPSNAGSYTVTATIAATTNYNVGTCSKAFTINRANISPSVAMNNWTYGSTASNPSVSGNSGNGTVTYNYKGTVNGGTSNGYNSTTKPSNAGSYTVTATVPQTNNYNAGTCSKTFTINRASISPAVLMMGWTYGGTAGTPALDGNTGNGAVTYTYTGTVNGGTNYNSSTKPSNAGSYKVKASIAQTNNYSSGSCETSFNIARANTTPSVAMSDWTYGSTASNPSVTSLSNGAMTYTYTGTVNGGVSNGYNSSTKPSNAGSYKVTVSVAQTNNYNSGSNSATFTIKRANISPSVAMSDWTYGSTASNPSVSGNSGNGATTYTYTGTVNGGASYNSSTKPSNAGSYKVTATVAQTNNYNSGTCEKTFAVSRANITPTVSKASYTYGDASTTPSVSGNAGNGNVTYLFKEVGVSDYSETEPVDAGHYTLKATIAQTNNYNGTSCETDYQITRAALAPTVSINDWTYKTTPSTPTVEGNEGGAEVEYLYKQADADDDTYTTKQPKKAGFYTVQATVPATRNYLGGTTTTDFEIERDDLDLSVSMDDFVYGNTPSSPIVVGNLGGGQPVFTYKAAGSSTFTPEKPVTVGTHTVKVVIPETQNYFGGEATSTYTVTKANLNLGVYLPNFVYGTNPPSPFMMGNVSGGFETVMYKEATANDTTYSTEIPTAVGTYMIRYRVEATDNYNAGVATNTFKITKATIHPQVTIENWTRDETPNTPKLTGNLGNGAVTYSYKVRSAGDDTYTTEVPLAAGLYTIKATIAETATYNGAECSYDFRITKATLYPTLYMNDVNYGHPLTPIVSNNLGGGEVTYMYKEWDSDGDFEETPPTDLGHYIVQATIAETENYSGATVTRSFKIIQDAANISVLMPDWTYGETASLPVLSGNVEEGEELVEYKVAGADDASYSVNKPSVAGHYNVRYTVYETTHYATTTVTNTFDIVPYNINADRIVIDDIDAVTFNEEEQTPTVTVKDVQTELVKDTDYTVEYADNRNAGTATITITGIGNYCGSKDVSFTIDKADITPTITVNDWVYGEEPSVPIKTGNVGLGAETIEYKLTSDDNDAYSEEIPTQAGEYVVKYTVRSTYNYNGNVDMDTFTIDKAAIDLDRITVSAIDDIVYDGEAHTPDIAVKDGETVLSKDADYTVEYHDNTNCGEATVTITGIGNYTGTRTQTFNILKKDLVLSVTMDDFTYGQEPSEPVVSGNISDGVTNIMYKLTSAEDTTFSEDMPTEAGDYTVRYTVEETDNHNEASATDTFTINKADITTTVSLANWEYDKLPAAPVVTGNAGDGTETIEYKLTSDDDTAYVADVPTEIGDYTIRYTVDETANYNGNVVTNTFKITKATLTLSVEIEDWVYSNEPASPIVNGNVEEGAETIEYKLTAEDDDTYTTDVPTEVGDYTIRYSVESTEHYKENSVTNTFKITKNVFEPTVSIEGWSYGEDANEPVITGNVSHGAEVIEYKLSSEDDDSYSEEVPVNAGAYIIRLTIAETANYAQISVTNTFTIAKIDIAPTVSIDGWTYGEDVNEPVANGNLGNGQETIEYKLTSEDDEAYSTEVPVNAGNYTIRYTVGASTNYNGNFATNTFVIAKADIDPAVTLDDFVFGDNTKTPHVTGNSGNGDVTYTYKAEDTDEFVSDMIAHVGTHTVKAEIAETSNYKGETVTSTYTVSKADVDLSVSVDNWVYGNEASTPVLSGNLENGEETIEYKLEVEEDDAYTADVPENVGDYTVRYSVGATSNYKAGSTTNTFRITKMLIDPVVEIEDWTFGDEPNEPTLTGNVGNGAETILYKLSSEDDDAYTEDVPENAGTYNVKYLIAETSTHEGGVATSTFNINKKITNLTVEMNDFTYGDEASEPTVNGVDGTAVSYLYKAEGSDDFMETKPVVAGTHTVKAIIAESDNYKGGEATSTYTVIKADITPTVTLANWTYGEDANEPVVEGNSGNGDISYLYKIKTEDDESYKAEKPVEVGVYVVKAVIEETANYKGGVATCEFEIEPVVTVGKPSITINASCQAVIAAGTIENDTVKAIEYRLNDGDWTPYTEPITLYKAYTIEARQTTTRTGKISDIVKKEGVEPVESISAEYTGGDKYINDVVDKNDLLVTVHYPNSEDENTTDFVIDDATITSEGENTFTISAFDKQTTITVNGKSHNEITDFFDDGVIDVNETHTFPQNTTIVVNGEQVEFTSGTFTFDDAGIYTITLPDNTSYTVVVVDEQEIATAKEMLTNSEDPIRQHQPYSLPKGTKIVRGDNVITVSEDTFTFDKSGTYDVILPDNTKVTVSIIDKQEVEEAKEVLSSTEEPFTTEDEIVLPPDTVVTFGEEVITIGDEAYVFNKPGEYEVTLPDGSTYSFIVIDETEMAAAEDELKELQKNASSNDDVTLPVGSTVTLDGQSVDMTGDNFTFDKVGTYVVALPNGNTYTIVIKAPEVITETATPVSETPVTTEETTTVPDVVPVTELTEDEQALLAKVKKVKPKIVSLTSKKKGKLKLTFSGLSKKLSQQDIRYQIQLSTNKKFKNVSTRYSGDNARTLKQLKSKKTYYVRVRLMKKGDDRIVSKWSKTAKLKVK